VGIDPKHHRSIFDPFFSTRGSSGLGLALVHRIVDEHGGYVSFESSPGEGSVFYVNLPAGVDAGTARARERQEM
ncbi:MAG: molecular chaperone Hsp90, partial [Thermoleophilia bacterium]|nr:molecular chaperone Hsp90 [Thermoleophilia bacterium]